MELLFNHIGFDNLFVNEFNAVIFSLFGMGVVFTGLVIICLYVLFLPKFLHLFDRQSKKDTTEQPQDAVEEKEVLMAIATAFYLHRNFPEENQKITWKSHGDVDSLWQISGRVQGMSQRTHVSRRFFPHR